MGRTSSLKKRKKRTEKVAVWTQPLLQKIKYADLNKVTMTDLAKLMGKSKSTVYEYFTTKQELFEYITIHRIRQLSSYQIEIEIATVDFEVYIANFINILTEGTRDISAHYLSQLKTHFKASWNLVMDFLKRILKDLQILYTRGIEQGIFHNISTELITKLDEYFIIQLITDYRFVEQSGQSLQKLIKDYLFLKFEGLKIRNASLL